MRHNGRFVSLLLKAAAVLVVIAAIYSTLCLARELAAT